MLVIYSEDSSSFKGTQWQRFYEISSWTIPFHRAIVNLTVAVSRYCVCTEVQCCSASLTMWLKPSARQTQHRNLISPS